MCILYCFNLDMKGYRILNHVAAIDAIIVVVE